MHGFPKTQGRKIRIFATISLGTLFVALVITFCSNFDKTAISALLQFPSLSFPSDSTIGTPLEGKNEYILTIPSGKGNSLPSWEQLTGKKSSADQDSRLVQSAEIWHKSQKDARASIRMQSTTTNSAKKFISDLLGRVLDVHSKSQESINHNEDYYDTYRRDHQQLQWGPHRSQTKNRLNHAIQAILLGDDRLDNDSDSYCLGSKLSIGDINTCIKNLLLMASKESVQKDQNLIDRMKSQKQHSEEMEEEAARKIYNLQSENRRLRDELSISVPEEELQRTKGEYQERLVLLKEVIGAYLERNAHDSDLGDTGTFGNDFSPNAETSQYAPEEIEAANALLRLLDRRRKVDHDPESDPDSSRKVTSDKSRRSGDGGSSCDGLDACENREHSPIPVLLPLAERRAYVSSGSMAEGHQTNHPQSITASMTHARPPPALDEAARRVAEALSAIAGSKKAVASAVSAQMSGVSAAALPRLPNLPPLK